MSDRLKTDLYTIWDRGRHGISWEDSWVQDFLDDIASDPAAAGRFLALTETGPDYEAAAIAFVEVATEASWDMVTGADQKAWLEDITVAVDASLADYLTEEE